MNDDLSHAQSSAPTRTLALRQALEGAVFPLSAVQLALVARENGAPAALLTLLGGLPRGDFRSLEAVESRLGQESHPGLGESRGPGATIQR